MELYEEKQVNEKKSKLPMVIGICLVILIILTIAIMMGIVYLKNTVTTINIDGQKNAELEELIYIKEEANKTNLYVPIRKIAKHLKYEDYRGDYKNKSEDETQCYVKTENEVAMFALDSDILTKTTDNSEYNYIQLDEKVFEKDGELYTTIDGIEKAFNVEIATDENYQNIDIFTMNYLVTYFKCWA